MTKPVSFNCPNCNALYKMVRVEAAPTAIEREIACRRCGAPLQGREGAFIFKYFLVDRPKPGIRIPAATSGISAVSPPQ